LGFRPLEKVRYGGAVDNVGGEMLSRILAHVQLWGNVASIGMAQSGELHTTVMPFILRGVSLLGTSSNNCAQDLRQQIWNRLGSNLKPKHLDAIVSRMISLKELPQAFEDLIERRVQGRIVVEVRR
jgi:acrylyl-CoA reductase (NADPH)